MPNETQVAISTNTTILPVDLPEHWSPWVAQTMRELYAAEAVLFPFIPESAPDWVQDLLLEVVKVSHPTINWNFSAEPGEVILGSTVGHFRHLYLHKDDPQNRIARFSLYDARLNGAGYLCKCLGVDDSRLTKDIYETAKFDWGDNELTLSDSVIKVARTYLR